MELAERSWPGGEEEEEAPRAGKQQTRAHLSLPLFSLFVRRPTKQEKIQAISSFLLRF
jgi:hypothetical protein